MAADEECTCLGALPLLAELEAASQSDPHGAVWNSSYVPFEQGTKHCTGGMPPLGAANRRHERNWEGREEEQLQYFLQKQQ